MRRLLAPLLLAGLMAGASAADLKPVADPSRPESAILLPVQLLRANDFKGFYDAMPAADKAKAQAEWAKAASKEAEGKKGEHLDEINDMLAKLLAPNAVETLMAEARPKLAEMKPQEISQGMQMIGMMLAMSQMQQPQDGKKPDPASKAAMAALGGILTDASQWVLTAGINDEAKCRKAIERLVAGAKTLGVKDVRELQALPLDQFLARLSPLVKEAKAAAGVYDVQIDAFLDSVKVTASPAKEGKSTLQVSFASFGKPYTVPVEVMQKDGHWVVNPKAAKPLAGMLPMGGADADADEVEPAMPAAPQPKKKPVSP